MAKSLAKMDPRQKDLLKGALNVSNEEIQLMEDNKTRADVESEAKATEEEANSELKEEIDTVNATPTQPVSPVSSTTGGKRRRRTKKQRRRESRRKSHRKPRRKHGKGKTTKRMLL